MRILTFILLLNSSLLLSHSGGTNQDGCHTNHSSGSYHCHDAKPYSYTQSYCHMKSGEKRCGYAKSTCDSLVRNYGGYCQIEF